MSENLRQWPEEEHDAEREALCLDIKEAEADPRRVPHEAVRAWVLRVANGELDAPPPEPH